MKKCVYCGAELNDNAKACSNCGRILPKEDWPEEKKADDDGKNQSGNGWGGQDSAWDSRNAGSGRESRNSSGWGGQNSGNNGWNTQNGQNPYGQNPYGQNPYGQNFCGNVQGYGNQPPQQQKTNTFAIVAFVQGILSVFLNSVLFFIPSVMAIVFGCISLSQLKQNPEQKGKGMAVAGLVLGIVFLILTIVLTILAVWLISSDSEFSRMFQEIYKQLEGGSGV